MTGLVDIATRTLAAAVLRPSTKAVDAALPDSLERCRCKPGYR
jgi:hypothetical protein